MMRLLMRYAVDAPRWVYLVSQFEQSPRKYNPGDFYLASSFPLPALTYDYARAHSEEAPDVLNAVTVKLASGEEYHIPTRDIIPPKSANAAIVSPGVRVDDSLKKLFLATLFMPGDTPLFMRYAPHFLCVTNAGTGKSSLGESCGNLVVKATENALLGFGTSDRVRIGSLAGLNGGPVFLDEMLEKIGDDLFGQLLTLMELGKARVISGAADFSFHCASPFGFLANPRPADEGDAERSLYELFTGTMRKLSTNTNAFGRRFACIEFGTDFKTVSGDSCETDGELTERNFRLSRRKLENGAKLAEAMSDKATLAWLNKPYDEKYLARIGEIKAKASDRLLRLFIAGHALSYRHARGLALRLSIASNESDREEEFAWVQSENLASFSRILDCSNEYGEEIRVRYKEGAVTDYLAYFFLRLGEAMTRLNSKTVPWSEVHSASLNVMWGYSREEWERKVVARLQEHFSDDFDANLDRIEILRVGALNLVNLAKFAGRPWLTRED